MKLKHAAIFRAGATPETSRGDFWSENGDGTPWVAIGDMSSGRAVTVTAKRLTSSGMADRSLSTSPPGTVLFAMYASVGAVATLAVDAVWNQAILGLTPKSGVSDSRFLSYWLRHYGPIALAEARTATQANLNAEQVANFPFPDLAVEAQAAIADFLDDRVARIDQIITARRKQLYLVKSHEESALERLVQYAGGAARPLQSLTDPVRPIQYGIVLPGPDFEGGVPIIKGGDIGSGRLGRLELNRTDPEIERAYVRSRVRPGDLVIAIRGSVGEVAVVPHGLTLANLTQDSARIAPYECDMAWLRAVLESPGVQASMTARITGSTVKGINIQDLRKIPVPVPTLGSQREVGAKADALREAAAEHLTGLNQSIGLMQEYKQSLITAAVTGEIDVTTSGSGIRG